MTLVPALSMADLAVFVRKVQLYTLTAHVEWTSIDKRVLVPLAGVSLAVWQQAARWGIQIDTPATPADAAPADADDLPVA